MEEPIRFIDTFICFFAAIMAWGLLCFSVAAILLRRRQHRHLEEHFVRLRTEGKSTVPPKPRLRSGVDSRKQKRALRAIRKSEWPSYGPFVLGSGELSSALCNESAPLPSESKGGTQ